MWPRNLWSRFLLILLEAAPLVWVLSPLCASLRRGEAHFCLQFLHVFKKCLTTISHKFTPNQGFSGEFTTNQGFSGFSMVEAWLKHGWCLTQPFLSDFGRSFERPVLASWWPAAAGRSSCCRPCERSWTQRSWRCWGATATRRFIVILMGF